MNVTSSQQVTIAAPIGEVLAVVRDVANQHTWWPGMLASDVLEQDDDGRVVRARIVNDVKVARDTFEVRYADTDTSMTWELTAPSRAQRAQRGSWTFDADGASTHATLTLTIDASLPLPGFVQRKVVGDAVRSATDALKRHCEA